MMFLTWGEQREGGRANSDAGPAGALAQRRAPSTPVSASLSPCRRPVQLQRPGERRRGRMQRDDGAVPLPGGLRGAAVRELCRGLLPGAEEPAVPTLRLQPPRLQQPPL